MKKPLILIAGPTASGKTSSSVLLAQKINGEIISADSMQVYKKMDIGTAKIKEAEMGGIPHYMIDELDADACCNVSWFKEKVYTYIDAIHEKGKIPILVGGTGFYLNAILFDTTFEEADKDDTYRKELEQIALEKGPLFLHEKLKEVDAESAATIHPNNMKRVIRALEYFYQTQTPISKHNEEQKSKKQMNESPFNYSFFALDMDRDVLYSRINQRVDQMLLEGVVDEVRGFYEAGFTEDMTSMKAIGYKEFFPYFKGESDLETCIDKLKQSTRQYAKRQLTWMRHQGNPHHVPVDKLGFDAEKIVAYMLKTMEDIGKSV